MDINSKYVIIYIDKEIDTKYEIIKNITLLPSENNINEINVYQYFLKENICIIIFLLNNEEKKYGDNKNILEVYPDDYTENLLITNALFIIYLSEFKRSLILLELIQKYNKIIFYNYENLFKNLDSFINDTYIIEKDHVSKFISYYNDLKEIINENYNKNIKLELNKKINQINNEKLDETNKIYIVTFYKNSDNNILNTIQKTCIIQNIKNRDVDKILIIGYNLKNVFDNENDKIILHDLTNEENMNLNVDKKLCSETIVIENTVNLCKDKEIFSEESCSNENTMNLCKDKEIFSGESCSNENTENIIYFENDVIDDISFSKLIKITNNIFNNKIVCIVRSDIIIQNQENIDFMDINLELSKKKIFTISRLDRCINSKIIKSQRLSNNLFSTEQDAWLFKTPILLSENAYKILDNKYLYHKYDHLYLNKILIKNNYYIVNNTILKILRILSNNNINTRELIIEKNIENKNIFLLPDYDILNKLPLEHLIKISDIDENEVYRMKCYFFNKYLKNKIMNNI